MKGLTTGGNEVRSTLHSTMVANLEAIPPIVRTHMYLRYSRLITGVGCCGAFALLTSPEPPRPPQQQHATSHDGLLRRCHPTNHPPSPICVQSFRLRRLVRVLGILFQA